MNKPLLHFIQQYKNLRGELIIEDFQDPTLEELLLGIQEGFNDFFKPTKENAYPFLKIQAEGVTRKEVENIIDKCFMEVEISLAGFYFYFTSDLATMTEFLIEHVLTDETIEGNNIKIKYIKKKVKEFLEKAAIKFNNALLKLSQYGVSSLKVGYDNEKIPIFNWVVGLKVIFGYPKKL